MTDTEAGVHQRALGLRRRAAVRRVTWLALAAHANSEAAKSIEVASAPAKIYQVEIAHLA